MCILIVKLARSTELVLMCFGFGSLVVMTFFVPTYAGGL